MALGSHSHAAAEEGRSKLLLGGVPVGTSAADEVASRLALWENGEFERLLQRAEQQIIVIRKAANKGRATASSKQGAKAKRAKRLATDGAYRKATSSLISDMMDFDASEDVQWATKLLPRSGHPDDALVPEGVYTALDRDVAEQAASFSPGEGPLKGVRYSALTGPGPSGTRPEHITDMLSVPRRADSNKLHRALAMVYAAIEHGALPPDARWIARTRLSWVRKKTGKPRPIKMGEFLRSAYAKSLAHKHQGKLRKKLLDMHQWGVGMPGSCEALAHWRGTIEELILAGVLDPMIAVVIDLVNMFGNVEWSSIRAALQEHFPEALPRTSWQHQ
jgi:hypothetical protein